MPNLSFFKMQGTLIEVVDKWCREHLPTKVSELENDAGYLTEVPNASEISYGETTVAVMLSTLNSDLSDITTVTRSLNRGVAIVSQNQHLKITDVLFECSGLTAGSTSWQTITTNNDYIPIPQHAIYGSTLNGVDYRIVTGPSFSVDVNLRGGSDTGPSFSVMYFNN